jgi:hypothetical protein
MNNVKHRIKKLKKTKFGFLIMAVPLVLGGIFLINSLNVSKITYVKNSAGVVETLEGEVSLAWPAVLDTVEYDKRLLDLANFIAPKPVTVDPNSTSSVDVATPILPVYGGNNNVVVPGENWPASAPYPNGDAILPFKRILAYYGNFYSKQMGILGEYEPDEVLRRLSVEKEKWEAADPNTPVMPAIEYIAMVAQADAGADGMYRAMMPEVEIEKAHELAKKANAILILDMQIGLSTIDRELPKFKKYMERPDVHLALDPEFSMKSGDKPGTVIGTFNSQDINYVINYLSDIVKENKLPPKVLLVHRFTDKMVTGAEQINPTPEVQVVVVMDGWGPKDLKRGTYAQVIEPEPVQFAGIKIFYKNDLKTPSTGIMTPSDVLSLNPKPIYIQYQ